MNLRYYTLLKHKEHILYAVCLLSHAICIFLNLHYGFTFIAKYNMGVVLFYGVFILLCSNRHKQFFINLAYTEILFYSLFVTFITGCDFGTTLYNICVIPSLFFFIYSAKTRLLYHVILSSFAAAVTIFMIWFEYARPHALTDFFIPVISAKPDLYRYHLILTTVISVLILLYLAVTTQINLQRAALKTKRHEKELEYIVNHDPLTGLMNRRKFYQHVKKCQEKKLSGTDDYAITIFDIDSFKSVNDIYGHKYGDAVLKNISSEVSALLPKSSWLARWGGEEFIILFENYGQEVLDVLEKIRSAIENTVTVCKDKQIKITLTFGVSSSRENDNADKIIIDADNQLMYGKKNGKNRVVVSKGY